MHKEAIIALRKAQEEMKQQADKEWKEAEEQNKGDKIILSTKNLVLKKRPAKKLTEWYIELYIIEKIISSNVVKLRLLLTMRSHLVNNISRVVRYREPVKKQKLEIPKLVEVNRVEKWEVKKY